MRLMLYYYRIYYYNFILIFIIFFSANLFQQRVYVYPPFVAYIMNACIPLLKYAQDGKNRKSKYYKNLICLQNYSLFLALFTETDTISQTKERKHSFIFSLSTLFPFPIKRIFFIDVTHLHYEYKNTFSLKENKKEMSKNRKKVFILYTDNEIKFIQPEIAIFPFYREYNKCFALSLENLPSCGRFLRQVFSLIFLLNVLTFSCLMFSVFH